MADQIKRGAGATPDTKAMPTAREIAAATGLSLSSVYRALRRMEDRGVLIRVPGTAGGRPRGGRPQ